MRDDGGVDTAYLESDEISPKIRSMAERMLRQGMPDPNVFPIEYSEDGKRVIHGIIRYTCWNNPIYALRARKAKIIMYSPL